MDAMMFESEDLPEKDTVSHEELVNTAHTFYYYV